MSPSMSHLLVRGLFDNHDNYTCRSFAADSAAEPMSGSLYFHQLMWYIAAGCAAFACLIGFGLSSAQIFRYREPHIQRQLIRILWTPPVFGIFSFLAVYSYHITNYMVPIAELYEMFALVAVYFLFLFHLSNTTDLNDQIRIITNIQPGYDYATFKKGYLFVMQVLPVRVITTIVAWILTASACQGGKTFKHGTTALNAINGISAVLGLMTLLRFLMRFKVQLTRCDSRIFIKLIAFKAIVITQFLQKIVLSILSSTNTLTATRTMSYNDLNLGLNSFLTAIEVALVCPLLLFAFWPREFAQKRYLAVAQGQQAHMNGAYAGRSSSDEEVAGGGKYYSNGQMVDVNGRALAPRKYSFFKAIFDSISMVDIVGGLARAMKLLGQN